MQTAKPELETSLVSKCMEFTTQLANKGKSFKFSLCLPSGFNFSLEFAKEKEQPSNIMERKKKSPSTIRRNNKRREEYLKRKTEDKTISETLILPSEPKETPQTTKRNVTHDRFKCDQCGEKLDTQNCLTNHKIIEHEAPGEIFNCDICDFLTSRKNGIQIHISIKHQHIEQLDGNDSSSEADNSNYSVAYWEEDNMGTSYQRYLDVIENIETSNISEDEKIVENERATNAREEAFIKQYRDTKEFIHTRYPP